jgi:hypothetical protein
LSLVEYLTDMMHTSSYVSERGHSMPDLNLRRAVFVYEAARVQAEMMEAPVVPEPWDQRDEVFRNQFVDVVAMMCGPDRKSSPEELHDDWVRAYKAMGWTYGPERDPVAKTHPDMVPFMMLGTLEQSKDAVFIALCEIARKWI